ncbi:hypothetical protein MNBD_GAMMA15-1447 [hydrothermal vent metagenome]|uniref:Uncharacterized protein n=1 Tax=hydrothermal vent metagenome TaxID=652676 RepID=A0A3B0YXQ3_9ZZZZ
MDSLTFISSIIDAAAWPVAMIVVVYWFRDAISKVLSNMRHFRYGDAEFDFSKAVSEIKDEKGPIAPQVSIAGNELRLAEMSPRGAVLESWLELEDALSQAAKTAGIPTTYPANIDEKKPHWILGPLLKL